MIPMGAGNPVPSPAPVRRARLSRALSNASFSVPVMVVVLAIVAGIVVSVSGDDPAGAPAPAGGASEPTRPVGTTVARGSGWLNDLLVGSIVQIVLVQDGVDCAVGSGSVIGDSLHVLTNHHVVDGDDDCAAERISVRTASSASAAAVETHVGRITASNTSNDLAVLELTPVVENAPRLVPLRVVSTDEIGQELTVVGYPAIGGDSATVSRGILSGYAAYGGIQWIKTDALISGGNSGGAALDSRGRLLGIPTMYSQSASGEVVDCRNAADTNGDGRVDGRDQCVSTGGTIGLVAPASAFLATAREAGLTIAVES